MLKIYTISVSYVFFTIFLFGIALPFLISAADTMLNMIGFFLVALFPVISYKTYMMINKAKDSLRNENS